jgi:hypothetical protein
MNDNFHNSGPGQQNKCGIPPEVVAHYAKELDMSEHSLQDFLSMLLEHDVTRQPA